MSSPLFQSPPLNITTEIRPQADPLPSKRGEIGFVEGVHDVSAIPHGNASSLDLPERHPADRGPLPTASGPPSALPTTSPDPPPPSSNNETSTLSTASTTKSSHILCFLKPKKSFGGVQSATIVQFTAQILLLAGTGVAWFFSTKLLQQMASQGQNMPAGGSSTVLVHVIFLVTAVVQLVFLERRIFRMRGERYSHKHPEKYFLVIEGFRQLRTARQSLLHHGTDLHFRRMLLLFPKAALALAMWKIIS